MKKSSSEVLIITIVITVIIFVLIKAQTTNDFKSKSFKDKRSQILSEIDIALKEATKSGNYKCCIEPPCKMCFLGNWIWKEGTCNCETMIAQGQWDKVCPECKAGIKEGRCISTKTTNGTCPVVAEVK